ncbi:HipA family kinase [Rheinheimera salexigens]|uniref:HipA-like kinase domain-containing protein n=1 Tax=Rheinheimera salexigens TaxID=1628148 RepID=A0A1E7Q864_9GAMM|nr:HipA family kinase [Rheinheimera salexigens]OEY70359.1 hypothetical protein BI198_12830 [Rheinheimera salexigens]
MLQIGFATLYTTPREVTDLGNISPLWLGDAITATGDTRMYLKGVTYSELIAECLCTTIGSALGLPVTQTYIIKDPHKLLNEKYILGSEDADMPSFKRHMSMADQAQKQAMWHGLKNWGQLYESALFDEWIANPDRNAGNFLWDGGEHWYLIDHARALWTTNSNNKPHDVAKNILADIIKGFYEEVGVAQLKRKLVYEIPKYQNLCSQKIMLAARCTELDCVETAENKLISLVTRINAMPNLVARHSEQWDLFNAN